MSFIYEESVERKASRKEREGRARKGAKTTEGQGKHYGTSQLEESIELQTKFATLREVLK